MKLVLNMTMLGQAIFESAKITKSLEESQMQILLLQTLGLISEILFKRNSLSNQTSTYPDSFALSRMLPSISTPEL